MTLSLPVTEIARRAGLAQRTFFRPFGAVDAALEAAAAELRERGEYDAGVTRG